MNRLQWISPPAPDRPSKLRWQFQPETADPPEPLRGYQVAADGLAVAVVLREASNGLPGVTHWTLEARTLEPLPERGHLRPTALRDTVECHSEAAGRAEAELIAKRLLAAWRTEVAA